MKPHSVIVTADDYGAMRSIDKGILEAAKVGSVSCISTMSNFSRFELAMDDLNETIAKHSLNVGIGLHISLTAGYALTGSSSLTHSDGQFFEANELLQKLNHIAIVDIENEIEEQITRLKAHVPSIDHISHHMNIMCLHPTLFEILIKMAKKYALAVRNPFSMSFNSTFKNGFPPIKKTIAKRVLNAVPSILKKPSLLPNLYTMSNTKKLLETIKEAGLTTTTHFCDLFYGQPSLEVLSKTFKLFRENEQTEIMTHPGYYERTEMIPNGIDPTYLSKRKRELSTLLDKNFPLLFNDKIVLKAGFSAL